MLALLDRDLAAGILAVANLREQRVNAAKNVAPAPWRWQHHPSASLDSVISAGDNQIVYAHYDSDNGIGLTPEEGEHIAAEADPAHALAAVRRWRGVVERHKAQTLSDGSVICRRCVGAHIDTGIAYPCSDLAETADEARAYMGGAA